MMLRSLETPDESALAATLMKELAHHLPPDAKVIPWRRGADFFAFRVCSTARSSEQVLRVPLREISTSAYDGRVDLGEVVEREAYVHDLLRRHDVPVARLLGWGRAEGSRGHSWMLFERVAHDDITELTPSSSRALGEVLRRIHNIKATPSMKAVIGSGTMPRAIAARLVSRVRALANRVGFAEAETVIAASLEALWDREAAVEACLTHMDLRVENLCFRRGELVAVLDLSNCTTGDAAAELGRMSAYGSLTSYLWTAYAGDAPVDPVIVAAYAVDTYALLGLLGANEFADQNLVDRGVAGLNKCLAIFRAHDLV